jgi:hypothetical protein
MQKSASVLVFCCNIKMLHAKENLTDSPTNKLACTEGFIMLKRCFMTFSSICAIGVLFSCSSRAWIAFMISSWRSLSFAVDNSLSSSIYSKQKNKWITLYSCNKTNCQMWRKFHKPRRCISSSSIIICYRKNIEYILFKANYDKEQLPEQRYEQLSVLYAPKDVLKIGCQREGKKPCMSFGSRTLKNVIIIK